jgi:hypothetical protein
LLSKDKQNEHGANICFNHPLMSMCSVLHFTVVVGQLHNIPVLL